MNIKCPNCGKDHELVRRVSKSGDNTKCVVGIFCDYMPVVRHIKGETIMANHLKFIPSTLEFTEEQVAALREVFTSAAKKDIQGKNQFQFVMTYPDADQIEANKVEGQIKALLETRAEIRLNIAKLEKEIAEINDLTAKHGARLSELQTLKLPGMK